MASSYSIPAPASAPDAGVLIQFPGTKQEEPSRTADDYDQEWRRGQRSEAPDEPFVMLPVSVLTDTTLTPWARLVYGALLMHRNRQTGRCDPSRSTLAKELGTGVETIKRATAELEHAGLIVKHARLGSVSFYTFTQVTGDPGYETEVRSPMTRGRVTHDPGPDASLLKPGSPVTHKLDTSSFRENERTTTTVAQAPARTAGTASRLETILDGTFAPISAKFTGVDETLSATWLRKVLHEADPLAPTIDADGLRAALKEAHAGISRAVATADAAHPIRYPPGLGKKLVLDAVVGREGVARADRR